LYAWSGFAGEMAPNFIPVGGAEVATAKFTAFAAERFPALGQDVGRWFGQRSQNLSTWQDFLPQAQTILNNTKAQFGNVDAYGMAAAEGTAARTASGDFYSVAFQTKLAPTSYPGVSRYMHFKEANTALDAEMQSNPLLAELGINVPKSPNGTILGKAPTDWVWHHDAEAGVMQLVPKAQHPNIPGGIFWDTMHPGGVGGFSIWGQ
jgi:hypothetical protein